MVTVYEKRSCTTCRALFALLAERGLEAERVEYHVEGLRENELRELLRRAGLRPSQALRMREDRAADLAAAGDEEAIVAAMVARPELLQQWSVSRPRRSRSGSPARTRARRRRRALEANCVG